MKLHRKFQKDRAGAVEGLPLQLIIMVAIFFLWKDMQSYHSGRDIKLLYTTSLKINGKAMTTAKALALKEFHRNKQRRKGVKPAEGFSDKVGI